MMESTSLRSASNAEPTRTLDEIFSSYLEALRLGDRHKALAIVKSAVAAGLDVRDLYMRVFQPAMYEIGKLWEQNQFTVAQEHLATAITQSVMAQIYGSVFLRPPLGRTMVATCLGGELHEIGIRMVSDFFEMEGWDVFYLGANVPTDSVVSMVRERRADLLAVSLTLLAQVPRLRELITAVRRSPVGSRVKIMVGGQPLNNDPTLAAAIGADIVASDAREALAAATRLVR
jgi:MerR family transcriptional regulator, light-induced transcriptional regulator